MWFVDASVRRASVRRVSGASACSLRADLRANCGMLSARAALRLCLCIALFAVFITLFGVLTADVCQPEKLLGSLFNGDYLSSCADALTQTIVSSIAVDASARLLYLTLPRQDEQSGCSGRKLVRATLDGRDLVDLQVPGLRSPYGVALDTAKSKIYWTDGDAGKVQRASYDGTSVEDVAVGIDRPTGIAIASIVDGVIVFWAAGGQIQKAVMPTGAIDVLPQVVIVGHSGSDDSLLKGANDFVSLAVDTATSNVHWTFYEERETKIQSSAFDSSRGYMSGDVRSFSFSGDVKGNFAVCPATNKMYVAGAQSSSTMFSGQRSSNGFAIHSTSLEGGDAQEVFVSSTYPSGFALDASGGHLHVVDPAAGAVLRARVHSRCALWRFGSLAGGTLLFWGCVLFCFILHKPPWFKDHEQGIRATSSRGSVFMDVASQGVICEVIKDFKSLHGRSLRVGLKGKVIRIDDEGDARILFQGLGDYQCILRSNFRNLVFTQPSKIELLKSTSKNWSMPHGARVGQVVLVIKQFGDVDDHLVDVGSEGEVISVDEDGNARIRFGSGSDQTVLREDFCNLSFAKAPSAASEATSAPDSIKHCITDSEPPDKLGTTARLEPDAASSNSSTSKPSVSFLEPDARRSAPTKGGARTATMKIADSEVEPDGAETTDDWQDVQDLRHPKGAEWLFCNR